MNQTTKKRLAYFLGLLLYAFGACLNTKANLGITAITSVSYVFAKITSLSLGTIMLVYNIIVIAAQKVMFGKAFDKKNYLQLPLSVVFSIFIDACMLTVNWIQTDNLILRILIFAIALVIMGLGISLTVFGDVLVLPAEGLVKAICYRTGFEFGKSKIIHDCLMVIITIIASMIGLGYLYGIHFGTIVAALVLGHISRFFLARLMAE